jgi:hypothetical protein
VAQANKKLSKKTQTDDKDKVELICPKKVSMKICDQANLKLTKDEKAGTADSMIQGKSLRHQVSSDHLFRD